MNISDFKFQSSRLVGRNITRSYILNSVIPLFQSAYNNDNDSDWLKLIELAEKTAKTAPEGKLDLTEIDVKNIKKSVRVGKKQRKIEKLVKKYMG